MEWPDWWEWELELSPNLEKRMGERDFTKIDLREMLNRLTDTVLMWLRAAGSLKQGAEDEGPLSGSHLS